MTVAALGAALLAAGCTTNADRRAEQYAEASGQMEYNIGVVKAEQERIQAEEYYAEQARQKAEAQKQAAKAEGTRFNIPVLYYTQLMGIAFGCSADELGLKKLCVSPDRVIDKIRALSTAAKDKAAKGGNA